MRTIFLAALFLVATLAGCADNSSGTDEQTDDPDTQPVVPGEGAVVHRGLQGTGAGDGAGLARGHVQLPEAFQGITGTYLAIGAPTFEPTIGATSSGALFMTSYRGTGDGTHIYRSTDRGQNWTDVGPFLGPTQTGQFPNSNDPFLYVDPWTDRLIKFDMHGLTTMTLEYSDDEGETWSVVTPATSVTPVAQDHQALAAVPGDAVGLETVGYPNALVYCVNRGLQGGVVGGAYCATSVDGGHGWTPLVPGFPTGAPQCSGLHGHLTGAADGAMYRGQPSCDGPAVYRSTDGGFVWTEHTITTKHGMMGHDLETAVDSEGNLYAFYVADDGLPYLAVSTDRAETWSDPLMVAPPETTATGFAAIAAGDEGRVAFTYIGTDVEDGYEGDTKAMEWTGYIGVVADALAEDPTIVTVAVNDPDDPLDTGRACGSMRCGGFGDFIDITIDPDGRPWAAMAHNGMEPDGIVGTLRQGPALRGELAPLDPLE